MMNDLDRRIHLETERALRSSRGITPLRRRRALLKREHFEDIALYALVFFNLGLYTSLFREFCS